MGYFVILKKHLKTDGLFCNFKKTLKTDGYGRVRGGYGVGTNANHILGYDFLMPSFR